MLNESLYLLSLDKLKNLLFLELTILHVALTYVLVYVIYKALGRYIYFKPQEHAQKINRTFLALSLIIISLHTFSKFIDLLPFLPEYRWIYAVSSLIFFIAPLSILTHRAIWKPGKERRDWSYYYLPITEDYYKTNVRKSNTEGHSINSWEEENVESTRENLHSDLLLNILALITFIVINGRWAYESTVNYGYLPLVFFISASLPIASIFLDRAIFAWIDCLQQRK